MPAPSGQTRGRLLTAAIVLNGVLWTAAVCIYGWILATQVPPRSAEEVSNVVAAANLLWLGPHFYALGRLWRAPRERAAVRLALLTNTISVFYSVQCPLQTVLRYLFLAPGTTEATAAVVAIDVVGSFGLGGLTSLLVVRHCVKALTPPERA
jgi:hypothetical protein